MVDGDFSKAASPECFPGGHIIADLVQRSHCSIFHLILSSYYLEIRDLLGIVDVTPNVEHLDLLIGLKTELWEHLMYNIGKLGPNRQVTTKPYKFFQNIKYQQFLKALQTTFSININGGVVVTFRHVQNNFFPLRNMR